MRINIKSLLAVATLATSLNVFAAPAQITVDVDKPGHTISPLLWGIFFEDINLSADGGLYPELVRNRSFEGSDELRYWKFTSPSANSTWAVDETPGSTCGTTARRDLNGDTAAAGRRNWRWPSSPTIARTTSGR